MIYQLIILVHKVEDKYEDERRERREQNISTSQMVKNSVMKDHSLKINYIKVFKYTNETCHVDKAKYAKQN